MRTILLAVVFLATFGLGVVVGFHYQSVQKTEVVSEQEQNQQIRDLTDRIRAMNELADKLTSELRAAEQAK